MPKPLSKDDVRHLANLARLRLTDEQIEMYQAQLANVLDHIYQLNELDVTDVQPMAHPTELTNRLADDVIEEPLPTEAVLRNAPDTLESYITVPRVLGGAGDEEGSPCDQ